MAELPTTAPASPAEAVRAFAEAVRAEGEDAARRLSTPQGWTSRGDSARRLYRQGTRKGLLPRVLPDVREEGDRAAVLCALTSPRRGSGSRAWLLLVRGADGWRLEGLSQHPVQTTLFLFGDLPGAFSSTELPASPPAEAWARDAIEAARRGLEAPDALGDLADGAEDLQLEGSVAVPSIGRSAVGVRAEVPGEPLPRVRWFVLQQVDDAGTLRLVTTGAGPNADALFHDLGDRSA